MGIPYAEVIGDPIAHSKSPLIHKFWLEKLGIEGDYRAVRVTPAELTAYLETRRADPDWRGCNATMPLKTELYALLCREDAPERDRSGSFNCAFPGKPCGPLFGANTDHFGIVEPFLQFIFPPNAMLAVIGTGGAARTTIQSLANFRFDEIVVIARDTGKARRNFSELAVEGRVQEMTSRLPPATLLVNATPLGMRGFSEAHFDLSALPGNATVFDMVYDPVETALLRSARERGLATVDGISMLIGQARMSFQLFFKKVAPRDSDTELRELLTS